MPLQPNTLICRAWEPALSEGYAGLRNAMKRIQIHLGGYISGLA